MSTANTPLYIARLFDLKWSSDPPFFIDLVTRRDCETGDGHKAGSRLVVSYDRAAARNVTRPAVENIRLATVTNRGPGWSLARNSHFELGS